MASRLFIIRHGNTFGPGDIIRRVGAGTDLPLVASGQAQAQKLGAWFAAQDFRVDRLHCSPLLRARETAQAIATATGATAIACPLLTEIDHGPDEGHPEEDVIARIGADALGAWDREAIPPPDWIVDAPARIAAWQDYFRTVEPGVHLHVTSNGAARFALLAAGISAPSLKLRTGAFGELAVTDDGTVELLCWDERP
jgi:probable phosphoglycerate mutase